VGEDRPFFPQRLKGGEGVGFEGGGEKVVGHGCIMGVNSIFWQLICLVGRV
jgi:hypothetical protein